LGGIGIVDGTYLLKEILVLVYLRFPSDSVTLVVPPTPIKGFNVAKLLVGVSVVWSIDVRLLTVHVFPFPE
jgi:hypothetical protein